MVQKLPQEYRWVFNEKNTLMAIYLEKPTAHKRKMALLKSLIKYSRMFGIEWQLIYIVGLLIMIKVLVAQIFFTDKNILSSIT